MLHYCFVSIRFFMCCEFCRIAVIFVFGVLSDVFAFFCHVVFRGVFLYVRFDFFFCRSFLMFLDFGYVVFYCVLCFLILVHV
jgi:hypothetical protein